MNRIGWLLIGLGALLLLSHGGFLFFPLLLLLLFFGFLGGGRRMVGHYGYGWHACGGARQGWHGRRDESSEPQPMADGEGQSYTGKTTRL
jgi:hypothetical protein